jgi:oligopeptide/dipeptide ABC transporter ATP-binding protein
MTDTATSAAGAPAPAVGQPLLELRDVKTHFFTSDGVVRAVDGVTFLIGPGRTLGVVGESGCGKSITALSVLRLIGRPGRIVEGEIMLHGKNLLDLSEDEMRGVRGNQISMIFQEPMTSLNPVYTCGDQIAETIRMHEGKGRSDAWKDGVAMLEQVGIPDAAQRAKQFPHQMSGGMRQRVMIAMALATNPELLIADEPTTALDVTIQAQILELMKALREKNKMAIMLITHDLGVVAEMADDVVVMYAGKVFEGGSVNQLFEQPHNPYTKGLLSSIPRLGERRERLEVIKGMVPNPLNLPSGCLFKRRCPYVMPVCDTAPPLREVGPGHISRCWLTPEGKPPTIGADAPPEIAEPEAAQLSVEER